MFVCNALCRPAERSRTKLGLQAVIPFYREMPFACLVERSPTAKLTLLDESPGAWRSTGLLACLLGNEPILYSCSSSLGKDQILGLDQFVGVRRQLDSSTRYSGSHVPTIQSILPFRKGRVTWTVISHNTASPQVRKNVHCRQNHLLSLLLYKHVTN